MHIFKFEVEINETQQKNKFAVVYLPHIFKLNLL